MKKINIFLIAFLLTGHFVFGQTVNTLSQKEKKQGWELLFDGKSTVGWHSFKKSSIGEAWKVKDGALWLDVSEKNGRGDIVSDRSFGDFHFTFEWRVAPKSNSGIIFLVQDREPYSATWHTGPEYQLIDNDNYPSSLTPKQMSASLYDLIACPKEYVKPAGEWNTGGIKLKKGKLAMYVNGKLAVSTQLWDAQWQQLVSGSKFVEEKDFAREPKGRFAIQDHGGEVMMRNMKVRSL
jgi:hypothetical protein